MIRRIDGPDGSVIYHGRLVIWAGVGRDGEGRWTWWSVATGSRRIVAKDKPDAIRQAEASLGLDADGREITDG